MHSFDTKQAAQNALNEIGNKHYQITQDSIPDDLKVLDQWILWKYDIRSQSEKFTLTKVPYHYSTEYQAKSTDSKTWTSFENIIKSKPENFGLGFVFSKDNDILGIDIDNCVINDGEKKRIPENVKEFVKQIETYKEVSISHTGIHIIGRGQLPNKGKGRKFNNLFADSIHVEMYQQARYFTVSTRSLSECSDILNIQDAIDKLVKMHEDKTKTSDPPKNTPKTKPNPTSNIPENQLLDKIRKSDQGRKFTNLFDTEGGWEQEYPSQSEADLGLTCILCWWTGHDRNKTESMFRQSKLYREKYERDDYRNGLWTQAEKLIQSQYNSNFYKKQAFILSKSSKPKGVIFNV